MTLSLCTQKTKNRLDQNHMTVKNVVCCECAKTYVLRHESILAY